MVYIAAICIIIPYKSVKGFLQGRTAGQPGGIDDAWNCRVSEKGCRCIGKCSIDIDQIIIRQDSGIGIFRRGRQRFAVCSRSILQCKVFCIRFCLYRAYLAEIRSFFCIDLDIQVFKFFVLRGKMEYISLQPVVIDIASLLIKMVHLNLACRAISLNKAVVSISRCQLILCI